MLLIRYIGLGLYSTETLLWMLAVIASASVLAGWTCDAVLGRSGFGITGNATLSCLGMTAALIGWNLQVPLSSTGDMQLLGIALTGGFGLVLGALAVRRTLT